MNIALLEDVTRNDDGQLTWRIIVDGDISGLEGMHLIGGRRRWEVVTERTRPVAIHSMRLPSRGADKPPVTPEPEVVNAIQYRIHEELVRAELAQLLAPPVPAVTTRRGRKHVAAA